MKMIRLPAAAILLIAGPAHADGFMTVRPPVNPGDALVDAISADPYEYVMLGTEPGTLRIKLYGKGCSEVKGFSENEIYNWRICHDGTARLTDGED